MKNIKIYVSCHKNSYVPNNPLLIPIQTNAINAKVRFNGMLYDDVGDNISEKNDRYCELTAQYWAWKNIESNYYGFFHYRRYLSFSKEKYASEIDGSFCLAAIDDISIDKLGLNEDTMRSIIESNDVITVNRVDITKFGCQSVREHYATGRQHHIEHLDLAIDILKNKYPQYITDAKEYLGGKKGYFQNMYIMRKELFSDYSAWLFDILEELDKRLDTSNLSEYEMRYPGFIAERLFGVYITHLRRTRPEIAIKEVEFCFFENTDNPYLKPAFAESNVPVVLACSDSYSCIAAVALQSIIDNSSHENNYDIIILDNGISNINRNLLGKMAVGFSNFAIRFICVKGGLKWFKLHISNGFSVDTYNRLLAIEYLKHYKKYIYLDCDIVLLTDVAELFQQKIDGYLLGAVQDSVDSGWIKNEKLDAKKYIEDIIGLKNAFEYFNGGVMLINVEEISKSFSIQTIFNTAEKYQWRWMDQDVLNYLCKSRVRFLPLEWNVMVNAIIQREIAPIIFTPIAFQKRFNEAVENPKLVHYAGGLLPCYVSGEHFAPLFWKYAKKTDFYEELLQIRNLRIINELAESTKNRPVHQRRIRSKIIAKSLPLINVVVPENSRARRLLRKVYNSLRGEAVLANNQSKY
jgi:lipopolysaccharide biosynthesis glycosyltransferase